MATQQEMDAHLFAAFAAAPLPTEDQRPFPCTLCPYRAARRDTLRGHMARTHAQGGEGGGAAGDGGAGGAGGVVKARAPRSSVCPFEGCGYQAGSYTELRNHKLSHGEGKRFPCEHPGCTYSASSSGNLKRHVFRHTGEKPFPCPVAGCSYRAREKSDLKKHARVHLKREGGGGGGGGGLLLYGRGRRVYMFFVSCGLSKV